MTDYQSQYESLAEQWGIETDRKKETTFLIKIINLRARARRAGREIDLDTWMVEAIQDWNKKKNC